ncbi:MAG: inositol-3-phosphate synthase [Candidatus Moduliflexus flocculans]|nr:inositol-3-phosphate synthase [Candidatus Moduliflexus flocculans]
MHGIQEWLSFYFKSPMVRAGPLPRARPVRPAEQVHEHSALPDARGARSTTPAWTTTTISRRRGRRRSGPGPRRRRPGKVKTLPTSAARRPSLPSIVAIRPWASCDEASRGRAMRKAQDMTDLMSDDLLESHLKRAVSTFPSPRRKVGRRRCCH